MNYQKVSLLLFFIYFSFCCSAQFKTISGKITDSSTGENIIGAYISINKSLITTSNAYGYYSLNLKNDSVEIIYSCMGYEESKMVLKSFQNKTVINISLKPKSIELKDVEVIASSTSNIHSLQMSIQQLNSREMKKIPSLGGEADLIRSIQFLPGVNSSNQGVNAISVRGGTLDQNLVLLDEAILYNPNHALSFFSTFNTDVVSNVNFYKSAFPAKFGGRLSSVIDVRMREGNNKQYKVSGGIGLIASKLAIEGPIKKDISSFLISGRYSYAGYVANKVYSLNSIIKPLKDFKKGNEVNFYDLNFKFNYKLTNKDHIYLSTYLGQDHFYFKNFSDKFNVDWGNKSISIRWNHIFNKTLFKNTTFVYSDYGYKYNLIADVRNFLWEANMKNYQLKSDFNLFLGKGGKVNFGWFADYLKTNPGKISPLNENSIILPYSLGKKNSLEIGGYLETEIAIIHFFTIRPGIRFSTFNTLGEANTYKYSSDGDILDSSFFKKGEIINTYKSFEPRLALNFSTSKSSSLKLSFNKTKQFLHLLSNSSIGLPTDIWLPSSENLKPQIVNQFAVGFFQNIFDNKIETSIELYTKSIRNIIDFKDNAELFINNHIESQILIGKAQANGLEIFINKKNGALQGWVSYTLAKVQNSIKGINNNNPYSPVYDRRHNFKVFLTYSPSKKWTFSSTFSYLSGNNITVPIGTFQYFGSSFTYYTSKNGYKVPSFNQLDLAITRHFQTKNKIKSDLTLSINNVYNRKNIFSIYTRQDKYNLGELKSYKLYLYGILPSINYNFSF